MTSSLANLNFRRRLLCALISKHLLLKRVTVAKNSMSQEFPLKIVIANNSKLVFCFV